MKTLVAVAVAAFAASTFGQSMMMGRKMPEKALKATGGWAVKPGSQQGEIAYVNCQSAAKKEWLQESIDGFVKATRFNITLKDGTFDFKSPKVVGNLSLFFVDDPTLPMSLIAPEAKWAVVNVAPLKSDKEPFFKARVKKQASRTMAILCGGYKSNYPGNLTDAITKVEELDTHTNDALPVDVLGRFTPYLAAFGVTPAIMTTYANACRQGWAAQPTNDLQRGVWNKVHETPSKPIKIEP